MSSTAREPDPPIYVEVRRLTMCDPLKPNRLSRKIDRLGGKFAAKLAALKELAQG